MSFRTESMESMSASAMMAIFRQLTEDLCYSLLPSDWKVFETMNVEGFECFLNGMHVRPEQILRSEHESSIVFPSGLMASFWEGQLRALVLSRRERDENRAPILNDELEPSVEEILL
jgi:hypothetical protein